MKKTNKRDEQTAVIQINKRNTHYIVMNNDSFDERKVDKIIRYYITTTVKI